MKGEFLGLTAGKEEFTALLPPYRCCGAADLLSRRLPGGGSGSGGEWIYQIHASPPGRLCRASALAQREMEGEVRVPKADVA